MGCAKIRSGALAYRGPCPCTPTAEPFFGSPAAEMDETPNYWGFHPCSRSRWNQVGARRQVARAGTRALAYRGPCPCTETACWNVGRLIHSISGWLTAPTTRNWIASEHI